MCQLIFFFVGVGSMIALSQLIIATLGTVMAPNPLPMIDEEIWIPCKPSQAPTFSNSKYGRIGRRHFNKSKKNVSTVQW